jgi:HSP20 family molecular chaperone IbpA
MERKSNMNTLLDENRDRDRAQIEQFVVPSASVIEAADGYTLEVEMPGVNKEGLEISVENNELTIIGRRSLRRWKERCFIMNRARKISGAHSSSIHQSTRTKSAQRSIKAL